MKPAFDFDALKALVAAFGRAQRSIDCVELRDFLEGLAEAGYGITQLSADPDAIAEAGRPKDVSEVPNQPRPPGVVPAAASPAPDELDEDDQYVPPAPVLLCEPSDALWLVTHQGAPTRIRRPIISGHASIIRNYGALVEAPTEDAALRVWNKRSTDDVREYRLKDGDQEFTYHTLAIPF